MSKVYIIVFFLFLLSKTNASYQKPLESFKELLPYKFETLDGREESFFRYMVRQLGGAIGIEIPEAPWLQGEIIIYTTHSKVLKQYDNWENYMFKFNLTKKQVYSIKANDQRLSYNNLFIIIKLKHEVRIPVHIRVFNELEIYNLKINEIYKLEHFLSSNKLFFTLETTKGNSYQINIRGNPENKHRIIIYENEEKKKVIYNSTDINPKIILSPQNNTNFLLEINNYYYISDVTKFISYSVFHETLPLDFNVKKIEFFNDEEYYYYINISDFNSSDEFIINIGFDKKEVYDLVSSFYGKIFIPGKLSIFNIIEFYPYDSEQNEFQEYSFSKYRNYYRQLIFKKPENIDKNIPIYVLIYIKIKSNPLIFSAESFNLFITKSYEVVNLRRQESLVLSPNNLINIPYYYTLLVPTFKNLTLFIYSDDDNFLEITYGNLLNSNGRINLDKEEKKKIYILNNQEFKNPNKEKYIKITLTIVSKMKNPKIFIDLTEDRIYILKEDRPKGSHEIIMNNCNNPFYLIENLDESKKYPSKNVVFQTISGNYDIRYKNFFKEKDEMNQILTEEKNRIKNDLITLKSNFEILYVNCEVPGILNIYFLENNINGMPINGQRIFYLNSNKKTTVLFPLIKKEGFQGNILIEKLTSEGEITVKYKNKIISEISSKRTFIYNFDNYPTQKFPFIDFYTDNDVVISVSFNLGEKDYYEPTQFGKFIQLSSYNVLIKIQKEKEFQNLEINMKEIENDFSYKLIKMQSGSEQKKYIPLPENSTLNHFIRRDSLHDKKWYYRLTNPYNSFSSNTSNSEFYFLLSFDKNNRMPSYKIKIEYNEKIVYPKLEKNKIAFRNKSGKNEMTGGKKNDYIIIVTHKCGNISPRISLNYYYDNLLAFKANDKYNMILMKNFYPEMHIEINLNYLEKYEGVELSYNYIEENEFISNLDYEIYNEMNLQITFDRNYKRLNWDHLSGADHYLIYILQNTQENQNLIKNDCFLLTQEAEKVDYTYYQYSKNGKYIINIVAVFENPINFRVVYEPIELNIKIKGNRKILYGFLFTLLCIIIYIIYRYGKINSDNESIDDKE